MVFMLTIKQSHKNTRSSKLTLTIISNLLFGHPLATKFSYGRISSFQGKRALLSCFLLQNWACKYGLWLSPSIRDIDKNVTKRRFIRLYKIESIFTVK